MLTHKHYREMPVCLRRWTNNNGLIIEILRSDRYWLIVNGELVRNSKSSRVTYWSDLIFLGRWGKVEDSLTYGINEGLNNG